MNNVKLSCHEKLIYKIIDAINKKFGLSKQKPKFKGLLTTGNVGDQKVYAIKPLTFMNNSGICIRELIEYFKPQPPLVPLQSSSLSM